MSHAHELVRIDRETNQRRKKNAIEIIRILSLHSLLFLLTFFLRALPRMCVCVTLFFPIVVVVVISLITDTK